MVAYKHLLSISCFCRVHGAERERTANHLGDIGAICNDVAFTFAQYQFTRLREDWLRGNERLCGNRIMMDWVVPGGVSHDPDEEELHAMPEAMNLLEKELNELYTILDDNSSLEDRLVTTGVLAKKTATALGVLGYVGRASGLSFDVRHDAPYAPYDTLEVKVPVFEIGDVDARVRVRREEILSSLNLLREILSKLHDESGPVCVDMDTLNTPANGSQGIGLVDGFRGEILVYVRFGQDGTVSRYFPRDPSWMTWPALEKIARKNIVPDFPVCNKSVNGSYSGHDL